MKIFKQVYISIPLVDVIKHIPTYAKFLKELCTPRKSPQKISLFEEISVIISHSLPRKCTDLGAALISCKVDETTFRNMLLDLGASVNLLPLTFFENFKLGELKPTIVELQLANRSIKTPRGLLEDVIIYVKGCRFLVDFLILDILILINLTHTPIILGHPFLATAKSNINCENVIINIKYEGQNISLNIFKSSRFPHEDNDNYEDIDVIDSCIEEMNDVQQVDQLVLPFHVHTLHQKYYRKEALYHDIIFIESSLENLPHL
ncbi:unnamed protein product [Spirodela intermedia]|uniref:Uncharacterized protein n=2 Tax=Spirodela intermedia TaxID=51605 RepID=A0A7I8K5X0_SPIIN|nr:unnamed protein product [Spirodela intermedia]CAA6657000.1 unnamed protein product [Spirodela intermedia]CAA7392983.1 unnamed protein product [Spirodela intermedia]